MQITLEIDLASGTIDLSPLQALASRIDGLNERLTTALDETGAVLQSEWVSQARVALSNGGGGYIQSFGEGPHHPGDDPFWVRLENNHKAARWLEEGIAAYDMKLALQTSAKVRQGKNGPYLIIPFNHSKASIEAAGLDPEEFEGLSGSKWLTEGKKMSPEERHSYEWGGAATDMGNVGKRTKYFSVLNAPRSRFSNKSNNPTENRPGSSHPLATTIKYGWKASPFENTYRFTDNFNKTRSYTTFRTMSAASGDSWIHPGIRAMRIAGQAADVIAPILQTAVSNAISESLGD